MNVLWLHRACLAISVLVGLPIAGLGLLLVVPAAQDRSAAVALLLIPTVLVAWAIILFVRLNRHGEFKGGLRGWILAFYTVAGTVSIWATTWNFSREGIRDQIFSPWITLTVALFFFLPFVHLVLFCKTTSTKQDMMNEDMQQQNGDVSQKQTHSAEVQEDKVPAIGRLKKCLHRAGQGICMILVGCFAFYCLVLYQIRRHNSYCDSACTRVEVDINRIISGLADYFAIPAHAALGPTPIFIGPQACIKNGIHFSALHGRNTGKITGDINKITISVLDAAGLCQKSYQEATPGWNNGVFTKTIESNN